MTEWSGEAGWRLFEGRESRFRRVLRNGRTVGALAVKDGRVLMQPDMGCSSFGAVAFALDCTRALTTGLRALTPHWELCRWEGCLPGGFDAAMRLAGKFRVRRVGTACDHLFMGTQLEWRPPGTHLSGWSWRSSSGPCQLSNVDYLATDWHVWVEGEWQ